MVKATEPHVLINLQSTEPMGHCAMLPHKHSTLPFLRCLTVTHPEHHVHRPPKHVVHPTVYYAHVNACLIGAGQLPWQQSSPESPCLFVYQRSTGHFWYNTVLQQNSQHTDLYWRAGWMAGQALHNRAVLQTSLAPMVLQRMLAGDAFEV